jgi:hypothetical protein
MHAIQLVLLAFAAYALIITVRRFRRGDLPVLHFALWVVFWLAAAYVVIRPEMASAVAALFGVGRGADVVVYLALAAAFYLIFRLFAKVEDLDRQLTKITRAEALKDLPREHDGK